jgi:DNA-binding beta-propeller fold protein YncE
MGLGGMALLAAAACEPSGERTRANLRPYWEPALIAATDALELLRLFEVNSRALAQASLTPERYATAIDKLSPQVTRLSESLIPLIPPPDAGETHPLLLNAADQLVLALRSVREFRGDGRREHLVTAIDAIAAARASLTEFVERVGTGNAAEALTRRLDSLGDFDIQASSVTRYAVLVGQFVTAAEARAKLKDFKADTVISVQFPRWVETDRWDHLDEAIAAAEVWNERRLEVRVERVRDVVFSLDLRRAPSSAGWKELAWLQTITFDATAIAVSDDGNLFALASRDGLVQAFGGGGEPLWSADTTIPTSGIAVSPDGGTVAVTGFDVVLLRDGLPVWQRPFRPDNQLLEEAAFSRDNFLAVRSSNASEIGHVFAYTPAGLLWGPTQEYIGAADIDMDPNTGLVAVGSVKQDGNQVVLISPDGQLVQRFGVSGRIRGVYLARGGQLTVVDTAAGLEIYDNERGEFQRDIPFEFTVIAPDPTGEIFYLGSPKGLAAYNLDGAQLWFNDRVAPRSLMVSRDYVCGLSSDTSISVIQADGVYIGEATTLASIRATTLAPATNLLVAASAERYVLAWQLPAWRP